MAYITKAKKKPNNRKQERQKLYQNKQWRALSKWMRMEHPICMVCNEKLTEAVHHKKSPFEYGLSYTEKMFRLLDPDNLICVCTSCHNILHNNVKKDTDNIDNEEDE